MEHVEPDALDDAPLLWRAFPLNTLPACVSRFIRSASVCVQADPAAVALPAIVSLAASVGNSVRLTLKPGWTEPSILWGLGIGRSGASKSPAADLSTAPLDALDREAHERNQLDAAEYERTLAALPAKAPKPVPPPRERVIVRDVTSESLVPILAENPRGVLWLHDEGSALLGSLNEYKSGKGGDTGRLLSLHRGMAVAVDRVGRGHVRADRTHVCLYAGIQPGAFTRGMTGAYFELGLPARMLLVHPPERVRKWSDDGLAPSIAAEWDELHRKLRSIAMVDRVEPVADPFGPDGAACLAENAPTQLLPRLCSLSNDARSLWAAFYDAHNIEAAALDDRERAAWSKLECYAARLALVLHAVRWACGEAVQLDVVDGASMTAAIDLTEWFKHETRRVYQTLGNDSADDGRDRLMRFVQSRGGAVTARDVTHGLREYRGKTDKAESDLRALAAAGLGEWRTADSDGKRGRPAVRFTLNQRPD